MAMSTLKANSKRAQAQRTRDEDEFVRLVVLLRWNEEQQELLRRRIAGVSPACVARLRKFGVTLPA